MVGERVAINDMIVFNQGRVYVQRGKGGDQIIDLTITAPRLASRIGDWSVLEGITLISHRCIEFSLEQRNQAVERGRNGEVRSPSWNTNDSTEKDEEHVSKKPGSLISLVG